MAVETLRDVIRHAKDSYGNQAAYRYKVKNDVDEKNFCDLDRDTMYVRRMVEAIGKHTAVLGTTTYHWFASFFGIVNSASVAVPIDAQLAAADICELLNRADVEMLIFDEIRADVAAMAKQACPQIQHIISLQAEE